MFKTKIFGYEGADRTMTLTFIFKVIWRSTFNF